MYALLSGEQKKISLFTDRALYRPGQIVYVAGWVYGQQGDSTYVLPATESEVILRDANRQEIGKLNLTTDSLGSFSGNFVLPETARPGEFELDGVTAVFFSGGDQNRLTDYLQGTKFLAKIREIYKNGGVIGGTSAGAAVMSKIMLTGEEENVPDKYKGDFSYIKQGNVQTAEGFGFIDSAIIDQHFIIRKRQNRLISLVLERRMKGVGIDEATAIIVKPDGSFRVAGQSQVMVFEPEAQPTISPTGYLKTNSLNVRILTAGDTYQL